MTVASTGPYRGAAMAPPALRPNGVAAPRSDRAGCEALLADEQRRAHANRLAGFFPLLVRWAEQRLARRS